MTLLQSLGDRGTHAGEVLRKNLWALLRARGFELMRTRRRNSGRISRRLIRPARVASPGAACAAPLPALRNDRWFSVDVEARPGINHLRNALEWLVREAVALGRTPVFFKPRFDPRHNRGHDLDVEWRKYIDLDRIEVVAADGRRTVVQALELSQLAAAGPSAAWFERGHRVTAAENARFDLIVRCNRTGLEVAGVHGGAAGLPGHAVRFAPSTEVLRLAAAASERLGRDYCAVHVRRDDMLSMTDLYPNLDRDTQPDRIAQTLAPHVPPGGRVLILTNERDHAFFAPLRSHFEVFQYFDFPELGALVDCDTPDNFMLFEVEKRLFDAAAVKVHTFTRPDGVARIALSGDKGWA